MHIYDLMLYIFPPSHERFHSFNTEAALITHHSDGVDVGQLRQELPTTEGELSVGLEELLRGETEDGGEEVRKKVSRLWREGYKSETQGQHSQSLDRLRQRP